jgi:hypothetical protein
VALPDLDITRARAIAEHHMTETCEIRRVVMVDDGAGNYTPEGDPTTVATVVCRRRGLRYNEQVLAEQYQQVVTGVVLLPIGTDIKEGDVLRIGGIDHEVIGSVSGSTSYQAQRKILVSSS